MASKKKVKMQNLYRFTAKMRTGETLDASIEAMGFTGAMLKAMLKVEKIGGVPESMTLTCLNESEEVGNEKAGNDVVVARRGSLGVRSMA